MIVMHMCRCRRWHKLQASLLLLLKLVPLFNRLDLAESVADPLISWDVDLLDELHQPRLPAVYADAHVLVGNPTSHGHTVMSALRCRHYTHTLT